MQRIIVIQTAFIGDVILATPVTEALSKLYPNAQIDFLVRKGCESLLDNNPHIHKVLVWDKKLNKYNNLFSFLKTIRENHYDMVINLQRFAASGFLTALSGAKIRVGFDKNPFSFAYTHKVKHEIGNGKHEVARNLDLVSSIHSDLLSQQYSIHNPEKTNNQQLNRPKLYPSAQDFEAVQQYKTLPYICIAPTSVWFTKQYPFEKWVNFIRKISSSYNIFLLGALSDKESCDLIINQTGKQNVVNLCGQISFLQSAALMKDAKMNYVNDSAPMHIASAMNAATAAIFCSTVPTFGFGPLSDHSYIIETKESLSCKPCGLHGYKACPQKHFKCAYGITTQQLLDVIKQP